MPSPFDDIFGGSGPQWTREQIIARIRGESDAQKVDPDLSLAVAMQESSLNPDNHGDNGKSRGLFHLQEKAAIDAGINPKWRDDPGVNIYGGVRYLKQKLDQSKGNVEQALSRYNRGTPDYQGIGDPNYVNHVLRHYSPQGALAKQQPTLLQQATKFIQPASAEAATPQQAQATSSPVWDDIFGAPQAPATRPSPPTATSTPEQAAPQAPQAAPATPPLSQTAPTAQTPPGASQTPSAPETSWTPGMRFQALPSITQLEPGERTQRTQEFARLTPALQEEFLRSEEPASDLVVDIEKPSTPAPGAVAAPRTEAERQTRVQEELRQWEQQAGRPWRQEHPILGPLAGALNLPESWRGGDPRMPSEKKLAVPDEAPVTEGITKPSTMIPLLMPGAGLKLAAGPIKALPSLLQRGARPVVEGLSQTAGWTAGRTAETGEVPSPGEIGTEAALNVAAGGLVEIPGALRDAKNAVLRRTPGAQILLNQRAVQEAEGLGKRVFNAQDKEVVGKAFDNVAASGAKLDATPVRDLWNSLTLAEKRIAEAELSKISSTFADALKTKKLGDWDIGELQHLRSELRIAGTTKRTPETQDLLHSLRGSVDEAIHNGMAKGSLPAAELIEAQKAYRKVMQAEDLQGLVTRHTKDSPNLKWQDLNLAALNKELRGGGKKSSQRLVAGMDTTERQVLQDELGSLQRHYPFMRITPTATNIVNLASLLHAGGQVMSGDIGSAVMSLTPIIVTAAIRSPAIMSMFKRSIIEGKGQLTSHHIDTLLNAIRHENEQPEGTVRVTPRGTGQ